MYISLHDWFTVAIRLLWNKKFNPQSPQYETTLDNHLDIDSNHLDIDSNQIKLNPMHCMTSAKQNHGGYSYCQVRKNKSMHTIYVLLCVVV
jgi:hypothetical protein